MVTYHSSWDKKSPIKTTKWFLILKEKAKNTFFVCGGPLFIICWESLITVSKVTIFLEKWGVSAMVFWPTKSNFDHTLRVIHQVSNRRVFKCEVQLEQCDGCKKCSVPINDRKMVITNIISRAGVTTKILNQITSTLSID